MLKIVSVQFAHEVNDLKNDFLDVIVEDVTGYSYIVTVTTPDYLLKVMNDNSINFIRPDCEIDWPLIIVKQFTQQVVEEAINEFALNNGFWLKLHQFAGTMDISILDNLLEEDRKELETWSD